MKELRIGQKTRIKFYVAEEGKLIEIDCIIREIEYDRLLLIFPHNKMNYAKYLKEGNEVEVNIYTPNGIKILQSMIINSPLDDDFVIEYDEDAQDLQSIQRREYVRIPMSLDIVILKAGSELPTKTVDIGGGGIKFAAKDEFLLGDIVNFRLNSSPGEFIDGKGRIINVQKFKNNSLYVMYFVDMTEWERDKIFKLIFKVEAGNIRYF